MDNQDDRFTYEELHTLLCEYNLQFYSLIIGSIRLYMFLGNGKFEIKKLGKYKLTDLPDGTAELYNEEDLIRSLAVFAADKNLNFGEYVHYHFRCLRKSIRDRYISSVYETIKNFSERNPEKRLLKQMRQLDWFKMLYILRNNASHFDNNGKSVDWGKIDWLPSSVTWNNFTVTSGQYGHDITYTDTYARELIEHCQRYILSKRKDLE